MSQSGPPSAHRPPWPSTPEVPPGEDWGARRHGVLDSLERLERNDAEQTRVLMEIRTGMAVLTTKVSLYAAGVAVVVAAVVEVAAKLLAR